jgi:hypothetical protein
MGLDVPEGSAVAGARETSWGRYGGPGGTGFGEAGEEGRLHHIPPQQSGDRQQSQTGPRMAHPITAAIQRQIRKMAAVTARKA